MSLRTRWDEQERGSTWGHKSLPLTHSLGASPSSLGHFPDRGGHPTAGVMGWLKPVHRGVAQGCRRQSEEYTPQSLVPNPAPSTHPSLQGAEVGVVFLGSGSWLLGRPGVPLAITGSCLKVSWAHKASWPLCSCGWSQGGGLSLMVSLPEMETK